MIDVTSMFIRFVDINEVNAVKTKAIYSPSKRKCMGVRIRPYDCPFVNFVFF